MTLTSGFVRRTFEADGLDGRFEGWMSLGMPPELGMLHAQGWHGPLFEREVVHEILAALQGPGVVRAEYDAAIDTVVIHEDGCDPVFYQGAEIVIGGETRTVYGLGNTDWEWHVAGEEASS